MTNEVGGDGANSAQVDARPGILVVHDDGLPKIVRSPGRVPQDGKLVCEGGQTGGHISLHPCGRDVLDYGRGIGRILG